MTKTVKMMIVWPLTHVIVNSIVVATNCLHETKIT